MPGPGFDAINSEEEDLVLSAVRSKQLNRYHFPSAESASQHYVESFEVSFAEFLGSRHVACMNSCTSALVAALKALGVGPGDKVAIPAYTFVATAAAVCHVGAIPIFCDIDQSLGLCPEALDKIQARGLRAAICTHMLGRPSDISALLSVCNSKGLLLVEDVAQACGGSYRGRKLGTWGKVGVYSFNIFKMITAGDGGALSTDDASLYDYAFAYHDHGFRKGRDRILEGDEVIGMNFRMTELSGAVLLAQLSRLQHIVVRLRAIQAKLVSMLDLPSFARVLSSADPLGETGTSVLIRFDTSRQASAFAERIGTKALIDSGRHYYRRMTAITRYASIQLLNEGISAHNAPVMTRADDVLSRTVCIGIGVLDTYLCSNVGLSTFSSEQDMCNLATLINITANSLQPA